MKVLVIGSINYDSSFVVEQLPKAGETISAKDYYSSAGGKGANQAVAASRMGLDVSIIGKVGKDDEGKFILKKLKDEGVDISKVKYSNKHTGLAQITVQRDGMNTIVIYQGANYDIKKEDIDENIDMILLSDIIIMQLEIPVEVVEYVSDIAYKNEKTVILNPAPAKVLNDDLYKKITYLTPNEIELEKLSGIGNIDEACKTLLKKGCKNLIVTLGEKGSLWFDKDGVKKVRSNNVNPIDTTAAGDSFHGALAYCISNGYGKLQSLRFCNIAGALTTTKRGAIDSLPLIEEVIAFDNQN